MSQDSKHSVSIDEIKKRLIERYGDAQNSWVYLYRSNSGLTNITIVSDHFQEIDYSERREQVKSIVNCPTGSLSLYTITEAETLGVERPAEAHSSQVITWHDVAVWGQNPQNHEPITEQPASKLRTIVFYSFKGGVGRTTALTHVAWRLAQRGKKVLVVDLDLEAPGLSAAFGLNNLPNYGIVDYFYERAYAYKQTAFQIKIGDILTEVSVDNATGRLFVIPAGELSFNYLAKVDDLKATSWVRGEKRLWDFFKDELEEHQLSLDLILIDSRTGINQWGAFSLIQAADESFIFLFPNSQNAQGARILVESLASLGKQNLNFVFSPIPNSDVEKEAKKISSELNAILERYVDRENLDLEKDSDAADLEKDTKDSDGLEDTICIPYLLPIAIAKKYPVPQLIDQYNSIVNLIDRSPSSDRISALTSNERLSLIQSLKFSNINAAEEKSQIGQLFQKTSNFEQFLDDSKCLVRGRKGTGKTNLYFLFLKHLETAKEFAKGRLDKTIIISGHGRFSETRLIGQDFQELDRCLGSSELSWQAFWQAYALFQMLANNKKEISGYLKAPDFKPLREDFKKISIETVGKVQKDIIIHWSIDLSSLVTEALSYLNKKLKEKEQKIWLLYDDLDEDFPNEKNLRQHALTGLFKFIQACDARSLTQIRPKVFLREDIWERLNFDNKSHFRGRDLLLQWQRVDFLRFAYRQAIQSKDFKDFVDRLIPIPNIDQATEQVLEDALKPLWGDRIRLGSRGKYVYRWVYDRLSDTSGTTFPRSLIVLLETAQKLELDNKDNRQLKPQVDRLFRSLFMADALEEASKERCEAMKNEYPELSSFFDILKSKDALMSREDLEQCWSSSTQQLEPVFEKFVQFLNDIGLLEWRPKDEKYRFADLYVYGFGMRKQGMR